MKRRVLALLIAMNSVAFAADHRDSPIATNDPTADINDVYTFVNPRDPNEVIFATTVVPLANSTSQFSPVVDYRLHIDGQVLTCRFPNVSSYTCTGLNGVSVSGNVGTTTRGNNGVRVYAGLRDDPFFFDLDAFNATRAAAAARFTNPGRNFFLRANTLAIVAGIPRSTLTAAGLGSTVKVYGSTVRTGGDGINPAFSGSWYNPANPGHGYFVEVVRNAAGQEQLNVLWAVYDGAGNQQWYTGTGPISGNTATVPVIYTRGGNFPVPFDSSRVQNIPFGTLTFSFSNCNTGNVRYQSTIPNFQVSGDVPITRLTSISGQTCSFLARGQIDRMGRPGINTALINLLPATGSSIKDAYNRAETVESWNQFTAEITTNLTILDSLDGVPGNAVLPAAALAGVVVDDRLIIDTSKPVCDEYLAVELGLTNRCGGRTLDRDVIDDTLGALIAPGVKDNVGNDNMSLNDWPFLGEPH